MTSILDAMICSIVALILVGAFYLWTKDNDQWGDW